MIILHGANVYTQDGRMPRESAQALAIEGGRIVAAGRNEDILALTRPGSATFDLHGQTVWPGLTDAHIHLQNFALLLTLVDCETPALTGSASKAECLRRVAERARQTPPGEWIVGHGWNQNLWPDGFGTAAELDAISSQHPIFLTAKSLHAAWANTRALQVCGISASTPDPTSGVIQRDITGKPTGILLEMAAMQLVSQHQPMPDAKKLVTVLENAQAVLWRMGLTGVHDFDPLSCFQALRTLRDENKLRLRVVKGLSLSNLAEASTLGLLTPGNAPAEFVEDDWLRIGALKLFADGALGPHTAAMLAPYEDDPDNTGMLLLTQEEILHHGQVAGASGLSLAIHAIGDRANREVLDGFAALRRYEAEKKLPHLRHRIEHVQLLAPEDVHRLAELDIIASMQPIHAPSDQEMAETFWGARCATAYAWRSLLSQHTRMAFGSDAPVESPNPFLGIHAAVNRPLPRDHRPPQALSLPEAISGFTLGPAYASEAAPTKTGMETRLGRLTSGYLADLIVLSQDPFKMRAGDLNSIQPVATMVNGEWVWQSSDAALMG